MRHILPVYLRLPVWYCPICRRGFQNISPCSLCSKFLTPAPPEKNALFIYDQRAKELIYGIKYHNILSPVAWVAKQMLPRIPSWIDTITWIPASPIQRNKRGYDQGKLLARAVSSLSKKPYAQLLKRKIDKPQTHKKGMRHQGPEIYARKFTGQKRILLLDDVITTGTSMRKGQQILKKAGALEVFPFGIAAVDIQYPAAVDIKSKG